MSLYDEFRTLAADLFVEFEAPAATITHRAVAARTKADRAAGIMGQETITTTSVAAILSNRRIRSDDGTIRTEVQARLSGPAVAGDRLTLGANTYTITAVEEINPDGGVPLLWLATLK